jgi:hypothetical protein
VVSERSGVEARARYEVFRLVVLALTLAGFMAMHGLASAGSESSHCAVADILISSADMSVHDLTNGGMTGHGAATKASAHSNPAVDPTVASPGTTRDDDEKFMTGCLLALLGALVALALRLVRLSAEHSTPTPASPAAVRECAARAPPPPLFLSLCVIRL